MSEQGSMNLELISDDSFRQYSLPYQNKAEVIAIIDSKGVYLSVPDLCKLLQIRKESQIRRIMQTATLKKGLRSLPIMTAGGKQLTNCLNYDVVGLWLQSIAAKNLQISPESVQQELLPLLEQLIQKTRLLFLPHSNLIEPTSIDASSFQIVETEQKKQQQTTLMEPTLDDTEIRAILANMPANELTPYLTTPAYREDKAIREATLAPKDKWTENPDFSTYQFVSSNALHVYFGNPEDPLEIPTAFERIRKLGESTALTARIILGLWTLRRYDEKMSKNGSVAIRVEEILEWRGIQKHIHKRYTDGFRTTNKQQVHTDLKLLQQYYLRGHYKFMIRGKLHHFRIDGPYLRVSVVTEEDLFGNAQTVGYLVSPGDWINTYEEQEIYFFAEVDRRVFQLNPQNQQHELRLALYLTERWRQLAKVGNYTDPIKMEDLLELSMIKIDRANLTHRFIPRIQSALHTLYERGILGREPFCLSKVDTQQAHWGKQWLASLWELSPPLDLIHQYQQRDGRKYLARPVVEGKVIESD